MNPTSAGAAVCSTGAAAAPTSVNNPVCGSIRSGPSPATGFASTGTSVPSPRMNPTSAGASVCSTGADAAPTSVNNPDVGSIRSGPSSATGFTSTGTSVPSPRMNPTSAGAAVCSTGAAAAPTSVNNPVCGSIRSGPSPATGFASTGTSVPSPRMNPTSAGASVCSTGADAAPTSVNNPVCGSIRTGPSPSMGFTSTGTSVPSPRMNPTSAGAAGGSGRGAPTGDSVPDWGSIR